MLGVSVNDKMTKYNFAFLDFVHLASQACMPLLSLCAEAGKSLEMAIRSALNGLHEAVANPEVEAVVRITRPIPAGNHCN